MHATRSAFLRRRNGVSCSQSRRRPEDAFREGSRFYQFVRYVERNALRANMVARAEEWSWSSLRRGDRDDPTFPILSQWPLPRPADWLEIVNHPQSEAELKDLRQCVHRGSPFGNATWTAETAKKLRIESTLRSRGRPRKEPEITKYA